MIGHIRILNAHFNIHPANNQSDSSIFFPNLVEITDYLLIFQAQNIQSLDRLFPKLSIIRGDNLFKNYALVTFLTNSLLQLNLKSLVSIQKGSVLFSRLYHTCYVNTIDWTYLLKDNTKPTMALVKNDCFTQTCQNACKSNSTGTLNCWNDNTCQLKCSKDCPNSCNLDNTAECCSNSLCLNCRNDSTCVACAYVRDLSTGECMKECPVDTLEYNSHSCIRVKDCSNVNTRSLIKSHHILNGQKCVRECPDGYKATLSTERNASVCVQCPSGVCKRDCIDHSFSLRTFEDLKLIKNCFRVKSLTIELRYNVTQLALKSSLKHLEEIEETLVIVRNRHLISLDFLAKLRVINGKRLYEKKFALFVHTNEVLRELWQPSKMFTIRLGAVKFFENPELCYNDIEHLLRQTQTNRSDSEVSFNFNGYRRLTCSNQTIDLEVKLASASIEVTWNVSITDLRRLKGFILSYSEVPDGFTIDRNDVDFMHSFKTSRKSE